MPMFNSKNTKYPLARVQLKDMFKLKKLHQRRAELFNQIAFMKRCLKEGTNPKGLRIKIKIKTKRMLQAKGSFEKLQLKEQLNSLFFKMKRTQIDIEKVTRDLVLNVRPDIWLEIKEMILQKEKETFCQIRDRHLKKYEGLRTEQENNSSKMEEHETVNRIVNISDHILTQEQTKLLNYGLKQRVMTNKIDKVEIAVDTEIGMNRNKLEDNTIPKIVNQIIQEKGNNKLNIPILEAKAMKELKNNDKIVILKADKGNKTVVMNSVDYETKLDEEVYSKSYVEVEKNPADKIEKEIRAIIGKIGKKQKKELKLFQKIYTCYNRDPSIFAQPKIHKPNIPLRPIISSFNTVLSNAASFITPILNNVYKNMKGQNLETINIYDLKTEMKVNKTEENFSLISFDIVNMYGSIPTEKAYDLIIETAKSDVLFKTYSEITLKVFSELLKLILQNSYFKYKDKYFKQIEGLPMGSSTSPSIAKIYVQAIEEKFKGISEFKKVKFIKRYMDDYICKWTGTDEELEILLKKMNELDDNIKFTCEQEKDKKLNFLDATITRTNSNQLCFTMISKEHDANVVLPGNSFQDEKTKRTVIQGETTRVLKISDMPEKELKSLELKLIANQYNPKQVKKNMTIAKLRLKKKKQDESIQPRVI